MRKKMKLPFLSHSKSLDSKLSSSSSPWSFPSCGNIKTLSFRNDVFTTFNSTFIDTQMTLPESFLTVSSSFDTLSIASEEDSGDPIESVIRGLSSDRLFYEPDLTSSLSLQRQLSNVIPKVEVAKGKVGYKESEVLSMESNNPCEDFRKSMEEMVEAHEVKDWKGLEELLGCYLKINGKINHGYIMSAFIDLLVSLSFTTSSSTTIPTTSTSTSTSTTSSSTTTLHCSSPSSPLSLPSSSLCTTPCLSSLLDHNDNDNDNDEDDEDYDDNGISS